MNFRDFFRTATGGREPYPYQERFAAGDELPLLLNAPTGAGKTATAILGWLWRRREAGKSLRQETPRRLVYCLPMRVLVEQSAECAVSWLDKLGLFAGDVTYTDEDRTKVKEYSLDLDRGRELAPENRPIGVHVLMGGAERDDWHLHPERDAILIGTQDMLLSRALNRGYAASQFHWPIDFGLLNNDCLWVFDEPQLMANGVSTSAQLAGLRAALPTTGPCQSLWMSATLEPKWLETVDFRGKFDTQPMKLTAADDDPQFPLQKRMTAAKTLAQLAATSSKDMKDVAKAVWDQHKTQTQTQTLVILNTVDRAKATYDELLKLKKKAESPKLLLIHSRFRPQERSELNRLLQSRDDEAKDRIIVATQVVEAGVDISCRTLITELCPWASMVQRIGRCNRYGEEEMARVWWIDLDEKQALPYEPADLKFSREYLRLLEQADVSPKSLADFKEAQGFELPFEHKHVLRRRDLLDLFDTSPDLSGNDIDISRFVRSDDDSADVQVFWRDGAPSNDWDAVETRRQTARRVEICHVPLGSFKKEFLEAGKSAYRFDHLDGEWQLITGRERNSVIPGQTFWIAAEQGGYDRQLGWKPDVPRLAADLVVLLPREAPKSWRERQEGYYDSDEWAQQPEWRTIAEHTDDVVKALKEILASLPTEIISEFERAVLQVAARWHDWGKSHPVFQSGICSVIDDPRMENLKLSKELRSKKPRPEGRVNCPDIAKAPQEYWQSYRREISPDSSRPVKRFRHELASALGVVKLWTDNRLPEDWTRLSEQERWLALYLIAGHHGKVRLSIRAMPEERPVPDDGREFACGIWHRDRLPESDLGDDVRTESVELELDAMKLGGVTSWTAHALDLRDDLGPFRLSYLEAILRAADCRASGGTSEESDTNA